MSNEESVKELHVWVWELSERLFEMETTLIEIQRDIKILINEKFQHKDK